MEQHFDEHVQAQFRAKLDNIQQERISAPTDVDEWAEQKLTEVRAEILRFQRSNSYRRFLVRYLSESYDDLQDPTTDREEPLCTCENNCLLMQGKLPPTVLDAPTISKGIEEYAHNHPGSPAGLFDADTAYREAIASVLSDLELIWMALKNGEIPTSERGDTEVEYVGA
ncbi:hypothetical protein [Natronorubrum daqingense]|uniref:Uncharacterized protein n=1 Tax=Natronorubrum daqingense TaxID=588898 RepID=A0A1N7G623_9EURY|nr:hypothetical protein [Natronorubrum daqingense]APX98698.1 hypothetical protein BB347_18500 [Natronorubrum daqingense]SIS08053.1 hypothetical protein SAMN05421809_3761 [Natronorubrum daqingense]